MTRIKTYIQLIRWNWNVKTDPNRPIFAEDDTDEEIMDFDLLPYLGWMEEELKNKYR